MPTVSSSAKLIAYGDPNLQDLVTGVENADTVSAYINIETPTGTIALKKTSEDGVVEGISFTIKGDNFNKTVKTGKDGSVSVEGLFPGTYTVTEQSIDRYEPQKTQTVTLIGGKTSTVTFSNTLKRGSLEIVKTSEDNLVEGMKFHLYGTSLSGLPVDEYAVTDKTVWLSLKMSLSAVIPRMWLRKWIPQSAMSFLLPRQLRLNGTRSQNAASTMC